MPTAPAIASGDQLEHYLGTVKNRIEAFKIYPSRARRQGIEGVIEVRFTLSRDGHASEITTSGDSKLLARAAQESVHKASPFPPLPPSIKENAINMNVVVRFRLSDT